MAYPGWAILSKSKQDAQSIIERIAADIAAHVAAGGHHYVVVWGTHGLGGTVPAGATNYLAPMVGGVQTALTYMMLTVAGTLKNMYVRILSAQPADGSLVFTLVVAGVASQIVITIPAGSAAGSYFDTTHTAVQSVNVQIRCQVVNNSASASAQIGPWSVQLEVVTS